MFHSEGHFHTNVSKRSKRQRDSEAPTLALETQTPRSSFSRLFWTSLKAPALLCCSTGATSRMKSQHNFECGFSIPSILTQRGKHQRALVHSAWRRLLHPSVSPHWSWSRSVLNFKSAVTTPMLRQDTRVTCSPDDSSFKIFSRTFMLSSAGLI